MRAYILAGGRFSGTIGAMLSAGDLFAGRYRILERIAQGGMGAIYSAEHLATEERVALKVLWPHVLGSKEAVESFQLEARLNARIVSEHIVRILDAGLDEKTGLPFLAMELLRGVTLRALIGKGEALSPPQVIGVVRQIAKALDKAHGHVDREGRPSPIVHRDLKPENVFVALREGSPVVKVLDFGIAKVLSENTEQTQEVRGTPLFMAYEQFTKGPSTPRLDIWALGLITFYLLAGRKYWMATAQGAAGFAPLLGEIISDPLEPPTARAKAFGLEPSWALAFDDWFLTCVNRDVDARFATAGAAATALEAALTSGSRLSKADVMAARFELTARVTGLLAPGTSPGAEGSNELTGLSVDDSALGVASAEALAHGSADGSTTGPTGPRTESRPSRPDDRRSSGGFAPATAGGALAESAFETGSRLSEPSKTLPLGTVANSLPSAAPRPLRGPMFWAIAGAAAAGSVAFLSTFFQGAARGRPDASSASAPLSSLPSNAAPVTPPAPPPAAEGVGAIESASHPAASAPGHAAEARQSFEAKRSPAGAPRSAPAPDAKKNEPRKNEGDGHAGQVASAPAAPPLAVPPAPPPTAVLLPSDGPARPHRILW